jgi:hypothetical protein
MFTLVAFVIFVVFKSGPDSGGTLHSRRTGDAYFSILINSMSNTSMPRGEPGSPL